MADLESFSISDERYKPNKAHDDQKKSVKGSSFQIFAEVMKQFNLQQYENIQIATKGKFFNNCTIGKCVKDLDKEATTVLGKLGKITYKIIQ